MLWSIIPKKIGSRSNCKAIYIEHSVGLEIHDQRSAFLIQIFAVNNVKIIKIPSVLDEFIDSVLLKFQKRYPDYDVIVELPDDFVSIPMDAMLVEQVVINILENAVQHAHGMTQLSLKVFTIADKAIFEIRDNGCGIEPERLKVIFQGYYHEDHVPSDSRRSNAGIGLSVCSAIIRAHGGDIQAQNRKSGGALFRFTLDMEDATDE